MGELVYASVTSHQDMHVLGFSLFFQPGGVQDKQLNEFIQVLNVEYFYQLLVAAHILVKL